VRCILPGTHQTSGLSARVSPHHGGPCPAGYLTARFRAGLRCLRLPVPAASSAFLTVGLLAVQDRRRPRDQTRIGITVFRTPEKRPGWVHLYAPESWCPAPRATLRPVALGARSNVARSVGSFTVLISHHPVIWLDDASARDSLALTRPVFPACGTVDGSSTLGVFLRFRTAALPLPLGSRTGVGHSPEESLTLLHSMSATFTSFCSPVNHCQLPEQGTLFIGWSYLPTLRRGPTTTTSLVCQRNDADSMTDSCLDPPISSRGGMRAEGLAKGLEVATYIWERMEASPG